MTEQARRLRSRQDRIAPWFLCAFASWREKFFSLSSQRPQRRSTKKSALICGNLRNLRFLKKFCVICVSLF
jgi:hypothetical protein